MDKDDVIYNIVNEEDGDVWFDIYEYSDEIFINIDGILSPKQLRKIADVLEAKKNG